MPDLDAELDSHLAIAERGSLPKRLKQLDDLLQAKGIDLAELERAQVKHLKFWQQGYKDAEGVGQVQDLAGITLSPSWEDGPDWPVVQPGPSVPVRAPRKPRKGKGWQTAVVLPDIQAGYYRGPGEELVPTHDEDALSIVRQVIREVKPDLIAMHGDNADFPEFSRYRLTPTFARTTQATVDRLTRFGAELNEDAPEARKVWLFGNHEERLPNYIIDNATAAFALKRGGAPDDWPVLSVPHLCRFDDLGIEGIPGYPANEFWINDRLRVIHGHKVNSKGSTAGRYLDADRVSTLYGHVHRREWAERTRHTREGGRTILAASAGCLCRIDGRVPSTRGGVDLDGQPLTQYEDWQQGLFVVHYKPGDGAFALEVVAIHHGEAYFRGQEYTS